MTETDSVSVTLKKPIEHDGKTYADLTFREAEVGDFMVAETFKGEFSQNVAVLAAISGLPLPAFRKIKGSDFQRILKVTKPLLGNDEATGD